MTTYVVASKANQAYLAEVSSFIIPFNPSTSFSAKFSVNTYPITLQMSQWNMWSKITPNGMNSLTLFAGVMDLTRKAVQSFTLWRELWLAMEEPLSTTAENAMVKLWLSPRKLKRIEPKSTLMRMRRKWEKRRRATHLVKRLRIISRNLRRRRLRNWLMTHITSKSMRVESLSI